MSENTIIPENLGKDAVLQIIQSRGIIEKAEQKAELILINSEKEKERILKKAYQEGIFLGAEKAHQALNNSTKLNAHLKTKIEQVVLDLIRQVLFNLVQEDINEHLKNTISLRVNTELDAYSKQVNLDETKITLEISYGTTDSELAKITAKYPFIKISKRVDLDSNYFILRSPYGEIESDPFEYVNLISNHLPVSLDLSQLLFEEQRDEQY